MHATDTIQQVDDPNTLDPEYIWELKTLFACDWSSGVKLSSAFETDIAKGIQDNEQRLGLRSTPRRTVQAQIFARGVDQVLAARALFMRSGMARWLVPLYQDEALMIANNANVNEVYIDPTDKRFFEHGWVAVVKFDSQRRVKQFTVSTVMSVGINTIALDSVNIPDNTYTTGDSVFPLLEVDLQQDTTLHVLTDSLARIDINAVETDGEMSLDLLSGATGLPVANDGLPILTKPDYSKDNLVGFHRNGDVTRLGQGRIPQWYGSRPRWTTDLQFTRLTRPEAMKLVRFFEYTRGRLRPFYVVSPFDSFKVYYHEVVGGNTNIYTDATSSPLLLDPVLAPFLKYLAFESADDQVQVASILSMDTGRYVEKVRYGATYLKYGGKYYVDWMNGLPSAYTALPAGWNVSLLNKRVAFTYQGGVTRVIEYADDTGIYWYEPSQASLTIAAPSGDWCPGGYVGPPIFPPVPGSGTASEFVGVPELWEGGNHYQQRSYITQAAPLNILSPEMVRLTVQGVIDSAIWDKFRRVGLGFKMRLDSDEMTEEWLTNAVMATSFKCVEVLDQTVTVGSLEEL